jgi:acetolactate synthase-1/2/3 large subunit
MDRPSSQPDIPTGAELLVKNLEIQGVKYIFGIPGAKIDKVFDTLLDSSITTVVCRHEQNAAFMAGGIGRMTGKAGVALVTSGPGCSNLVTGLATANSEGDPVVAIGGSVPVADRLKRLHQSMDTISLFRPITKFSAEVDSASSISEVVGNAFRTAESGRPGAAFISAPADIMAGAAARCEVLGPAVPARLGSADGDAVTEAAHLINCAERPVMLLGLLASEQESAGALRQFLTRSRIPMVCTYQGAGIVSQDLFEHFGGRVGLFHNQPGDRLLDSADLVVTVGYDPIEYEPARWNVGRKRNLIHIDVLAAEIDTHYRPQVELAGNISSTLKALTGQIDRPSARNPMLDEIIRERRSFADHAAALRGAPIHPLRLVHELQGLLGSDTTLCLDMGSFHIWIARYLYSFRARQILMTNGQQTLGVGLPWAIAACLVRPSEKVISISGDGGFLFSAMELETAVRLKCNLVHLVCLDGSYDMVRFQEMAKYGRASGVDFGPVDTVKFAEAFGAKGLMIDAPDQISPTIRRALEMQGPVVIGIPIDYRDNPQLMQMVHAEGFD